MPRITFHLLMLPLLIAVLNSPTLAERSPATSQPAVSPREVMTAAERIPHPTPKPEEVLMMTIKELGNFEYDQEKGGNIPADVQRLSGASIRLHGYMIPIDQTDDMTQFALVPDPGFMGGGGLIPPPLIQHTIVVDCPKNRPAKYCPDEIVVEGKLTVKEKKEDGYIVYFFSVSATSVKPTGKTERHK